MSAREIHSTSVTTGQNAEHPTWPDRYVRCGNCGYICNLVRDIRNSEGSRKGDGFVRPETQLDGAVSAGDATITVDSTADFPTPASGSITALASAGRPGTTVTSTAHGLKGGIVTIENTTSYNGTFYIQDVTTDTFVIPVTFVADDATGDWYQPEHFFISDAGTYATSEDCDSVYTAATGGPRFTQVSYTGITSTTFTGCVGANAHDDDMYVHGIPRAVQGCPFCGTLRYDEL